LTYRGGRAKGVSMREGKLGRDGSGINGEGRKG
jgi:hypothetical protein